MAKVYRKVERQFVIEYIDCKPLVIKTGIEEKIEYLEVEIYFENALMCDVLLPVEQRTIL